MDPDLPDILSIMGKIRIDKLLVSRGLFPTTADVVPAILAREVKLGDEYATSPAQLVDPQVEIHVKSQPQYVSRGGMKLKGALDAFNQSVEGLRCIDIGSSTGGFTDCLLQEGAQSVTCVDVNYGQLAWKIRQDPRVSVFERTNIRTANPSDLGAPFDMVVADLSFIGLAQLAPIFASLGQSGMIFIGLVKPQFESKPGETDERGLVVDEEVRIRTITEVEAALVDVGFTVTGIEESPIKGRKSGNTEYLIRAEL